MTTNELITQMEEVFNTLKTEQTKVTKKAKNNARKASTTLRKLLVEFKKASLVESKQ